MSRTIVELEAQMNPSASVRYILTSYLKKYGDDWAIDISVEHDEEIYFDVVIHADKKDGWAPIQLLSLHTVPVIKKYLLEKGMLQAAYDKLAEELERQKKGAYEYLFGE